MNTSEIRNNNTHDNGKEENAMNIPEIRNINTSSDANVSNKSKRLARHQFNENTRVIDFSKGLRIQAGYETGRIGYRFQEISSIFQKVGFQFEEYDDHLRVILPENWKLIPIDEAHGKAARICDERDRYRGEIQELLPGTPYLSIQSRFDVETDNDTEAICAFDNATSTCVCIVEVDDIPNRNKRYDRAYELLEEYVTKLGYNLAKGPWLFDVTAFWE